MNTKQFKFLMLAFLLTVSLSLFAVPAKRGMWKNVTLKNGKQVRVELVGDEHFHFFRDSLGNAYIKRADNIYVKKSKRQLQRLQKKAMKRRLKMIKK